MFTVTSDIHDNMSTSERNIMTNVLNEQPDFHIDIGDTFMTGGTSSESAAQTKYVNHRGALYFGKIGPSIPIFLSPGNHEDEEGWNLDDTGTYATGLWNINLRKMYFPTPTDQGAGGFYSGNTDPLPTAIGGDTNREDYYAWTWGDALFVVIDPFQYTMANPYGATAGEKTDDPKTGDQWSWTLGRQQYDWLTATLRGQRRQVQVRLLPQHGRRHPERHRRQHGRATSAAGQRPPATSSGAARTSTAPKGSRLSVPAGTRRSSSSSRRTASAPTSTATITGSSTRGDRRSRLLQMFRTSSTRRSLPAAA